MMSSSRARVRARNRRAFRSSTITNTASLSTSTKRTFRLFTALLRRYARWLPILLLAVPAAEAVADGGVVRVSETRGPFVLTVFSSPTPLRVGPADISVLVQRGGSREPVLDAEVEVQLTQDSATITAPATRDAATNKLLYASNVVLPSAGAWSLHTIVRHSSATAEVSTGINVDPPVSSVGAFWMYFALPPLAIALFAAHQWLSSRRQPRTSELHTHS